MICIYIFKVKLTNQKSNITIAGYNNLILEVLPRYINSSFIKVLLKLVRSSIFGSKLCILTRSTAECFRDKLPIFTPATLTYNYPVNRFISDTNKSTASLKVLESLSEECKLPASCMLTSQPKYHHVFVFGRTKIRKIKLLECCKRERRPTISQKISLPIQSPFQQEKMHPINERNTVSIESVSPRKPNTHVNTRYLP